MSNQVSKYTYDDNGRLVGVELPSGAQAAYSYDAAGNRTTVVEIPASLTPLLNPVSVTGLPKKQCGDFENNGMVVLLSTGDLVGWGDNTNGNLANGVSAATNGATQKVLFDPNTTMPPFDATIVDWAFTNANLYVVFSNGWVYSAGKNAQGQLGHGDTVARPQLKRIEYFVNNAISITKVWAAGAVQVTDGGGCVYFQATDKKMYACGENSTGNLGNSSSPTSNVSTPAPCANIGFTPNYVIDVVIIGSRDRMSAYMLFNNGEVKVAGYNGFGQLATGTTSNVTGGFVNATKTGGSNITNVVALSATGGFNGGNRTGSALVLDSSGNIWTTGRNGYGQLGLGDTTDRSRFERVQVGGVPLANIVKAELGGGFAGYGYALNSANTLYVWGYNASNNLFRNNTTNVLTPTSTGLFLPGGVAKVFVPKEDGLGTGSAQLIVLTTAGRLAYAGEDLGQLAVANTVNPGAYKYIATPRKILDGTETPVDIFVHGSGASQRWFVLTDLGNLYACGKNTDSICTGGVSSDALPASVSWFKLDFNSFAV